MDYSVYYLVDYWDMLDNHCVFRTNSFLLCIDKILNPFITDFRVYRGSLLDGIFYPKNCIARSATYFG